MKTLSERPDDLRAVFGLIEWLRQHVGSGVLAIALGVCTFVSFDRARLLSMIEMHKAQLEHKDKIACDVRVANDAERNAHEAEVKALKQLIASIEKTCEGSQEELRRQLETLIRSQREANK